MEEQLQFRNTNGELLDARLHIPIAPTKRIALICHGFAGSKDLAWLHHVGDQLAESGIASLRFDFSGHGNSEGKFGAFGLKKGIADLGVALEVAKERGYMEFALVGHSLGGAIALLAAPVHPEVRCLVTVGAPSQVNREENEAFVRSVYERYGLTDGKLLHEVHAFKILEEMRHVTQPTLLLHGSDDEIVPVDDADEILDVIDGESKTQIIEGGDHVLLAHAEQVVQLITDWVRHHLQ